MPDNSVEFRIADKLVSIVEQNFNLLDADKDGKITRQELRVPRGEQVTADDEVFQAALRLVEQSLDLCGHKEVKAFRLDDQPDGKIKRTDFITPDLTVNGSKIAVTTSRELAAFREDLRRTARIEDQSKTPLAEKELIDVVEKKFGNFDKNNDNVVTVDELYSRLYRSGEPTPSSLLEDAAIRYLGPRIKKEGDYREVSHQEKVSDAKTIPGSLTLIPIKIGKVSSFIHIRQPDQHVPAAFKTVVDKQNFVTPAHLQKWKDKAK